MRGHPRSPEGQRAQLLAAVALSGAPDATEAVAAAAAASAAAAAAVVAAAAAVAVVAAEVVVVAEVAEAKTIIVHQRQLERSL